MSGTVIRDFLVALTFKTDDSGAKKSKDALDSNERSAKLLSRTLIALASTAVIAVAKTANELEKLYYSSQRIGASANNIRAYGDAISQMGGSAEGALSSLESVARKLRESPGYEGMLKGLGVSTRDQNGQMRDRVEVMKDLSKTLQGMEYYKANAYAGALGIDESTLMAMRDGKFTSEMEKYQKLRKDMGLNDDLAKSGQEFAYQWRDMMMQLKALSEVIVMTAGKALIPGSNQFVVPQNSNTQGSTRNLNISQKTDIHISGVSDPVRAAKTVQQEQNAVNLQMTRNSKGVFD